MRHYSAAGLPGGSYLSSRRRGVKHEVHTQSEVQQGARLEGQLHRLLASKEFDLQEWAHSRSAAAPFLWPRKTAFAHTNNNTKASCQRSCQLMIQKLRECINPWLKIHEIPWRSMQATEDTVYGLQLLDQRQIAAQMVHLGLWSDCRIPCSSAGLVQALQLWQGIAAATVWEEVTIRTDPIYATAEWHGPSWSSLTFHGACHVRWDISSLANLAHRLLHG